MVIGKMSTEVTREKLIKDIKAVDKKIKKEVNKDAYLTRDYYRKHGKYTDSAIVSQFGSFKTAVDIVLKSEDNKVKREHIDACFSENKLRNRIFFVTSAVAGGIGREKVYQAVKQFEEHNNAKIVLLATRGIQEGDVYEDRLLELFRGSLFEEYNFNKNLYAVDMKLYPQQINPLTGFERMSSKGTSIIIAHPKQQMKAVPTGLNSDPHILWSTGAINVPYYAKTRSGQLALKEHVEGGLIVEVEDEQYFHVRQVRFNSDGSFQDLNKVYSEKGVETKNAVTMTLGDIHAGWVDENARKATFEQIRLLKPKSVFVGDVFDGSSISHHNEHNIYAKHKLPKHLNTLENELHTYAKELELYQKEFPDLEVNLVMGNHEEHLTRYLREARYAQDIVSNHYVALDLTKDMLDGKNPIEEWTLKHYPHLRKNIKWLNSSASIKVDNITMSVHGHKGHSGSRGSLTGMEVSYGKSNTGHSHSAAILRDSFVAGCMCVMKMPYTEGSSSKWTHSNVVNYSNGKRAVLNSFKGKWKIDR